MTAYPEVAREASYRAHFAPGLDPLRFSVQQGEISLEQLLVLSLNERRTIMEQGPVIDWYLGNTRVYKRITRTLLFAICPDVGWYIEPLDGRFVIRLPEGFSNVLAVKLAVLYMEQYLPSPEVRSAPWKVEEDLATYIHLAELFAFMGMSIWTANTFTLIGALQCAEWIEIRATRSRMVAQPHLAGKKKIVLARANEMEGHGENFG
ncbi:hypothetical protein N0V86_005853 [Didymella sp. IMI 355093]|nr:hypothetical protein N0V86_005853 [Didymella sp. IMI 355093]